MSCPPLLSDLNDNGYFNTPITEIKFSDVLGLSQKQNHTAQHARMRVYVCVCKHIS
jgi:hypothetical protein